MSGSGHVQESLPENITSVTGPYHIFVKYSYLQIEWNVLDRPTGTPAAFPEGHAHHVHKHIVPASCVPVQHLGFCCSMLVVHLKV